MPSASRKARKAGGDFLNVASRPATGLVGFGRSYGALSSATYSVASFGCDNEVFVQRFPDDSAQLQVALCNVFAKILKRKYLT